MNDSPIRVGRVMRSSTGEFTIGTRLLQADVPRFGVFVKAPSPDGCEVIGLIYDVLIEDDPFVRQFISADVQDEILLDQRRRQFPATVSVLVVGHCRDATMYSYLPPQPPAALDTLVTCTDDEVIDFTEDFTYFRTVLNAVNARPDELLAASLRHAAEARANGGREFLIRAGRELARLLAFDAIRLEGLLRRIRP
ncbi:MAG TPA: hypothetical protein VJ793_07515 [Anaerolineae bacterium]|nr:hypothetical protein [Anaerolineae bacterium]